VHWPLVNAQIAALPEHAPLSAVVSSSGLTHKGDQLHFDSPSLRELGRRYAQALIELTRKASVQYVANAGAAPSIGAR
jgi:hypothetical protein